jgi:hypothetical protein
MLKGLGNLGDMAKMMKQAQEMQGKMAQMPGPDWSKPPVLPRANSKGSTSILPSLTATTKKWLKI